MAKGLELIESPLSRDELAIKYRDLCEDPCFANVPGKIELDLWGRIVMTLGGAPLGEVPIATPPRLFVTDAAWASGEFIQQRLFA